MTKIVINSDTEERSINVAIGAVSMEAVSICIQKYNYIGYSDGQPHEVYYACFMEQANVEGFTRIITYSFSADEILEDDEMAEAKLVADKDLPGFMSAMVQGKLKFSMNKIKDVEPKQLSLAQMVAKAVTAKNKV